MRAWKFESGSINYNLQTPDNIYINHNISEYLVYGDHDYKLHLIGPKGIGKTLLMSIKSYMYRELLVQKGFKLFPKKGALCENMSFHNATFSKDDLLKFSSIEIWEQIWTLTLSIVIYETAEIELPDEIKKIFGNTKSCSSIITNLLNDRGNLNKKLQFIPILIERIEDIQNGIGVFIDSIDQALRKFLRDYHFSDDSIDIPPSVNVWSNAQIGLLSASYDINRRNKHLKIYSNIRSEAFNSMKSELKLNFEIHATVLQYNKEEIKSIFELNIELMNPKDYICKDSNDSVKKFFGFSKMIHPFARKNNRKIQENIFDFLYRHSLGRPREIVYFGNEIFSKLISNKDYCKLSNRTKVAKVRSIIEQVSYNLMKNYLEEIVPRFDDESLVDFLGIVQSNIIPRELILKNSLEKLKKYYSIGIIGYIRTKEKRANLNIYEQVFLPPAQYNYNTSIILPKSKYYLTHPAIDTALRFYFDVGFYNRNNIIGNYYEFIDKPGITRTYDVALSFAGEKRVYVEKVAEELIKRSIRVFYDDHYKTNLWGKDLYQHLSDIYKHMAKCCIVFISKDYPLKNWTKLELKNAQDRAFGEDMEYLLPVRFDNTEIPGLNDTIGYLDATKISPEEMASEIQKKLRSLPNSV